MTDTEPLEPPPYAEVEDTGRRSWLRGRIVWRIRIIDGICVYGPGYSPGLIVGWRVVGDRAAADAVAARHLHDYVNRGSERRLHRVVTS